MNDENKRQFSKQLSNKSKAALLGLLFLFVVPWVTVFILEYFYIKNFPPQVYVYKKDFCFYLPADCQVVESTIGDLNFYCKKGQSGNLSILENADSFSPKSKVLDLNETLEINTYTIHYEEKIYQLVSKKVEDRKLIEPIACTKKVLVDQKGRTKNTGRVTK